MDSWTEFRLRTFTNTCLCFTHPTAPPDRTGRAFECILHLVHPVSCPPLKPCSPYSYTTRLISLTRSGSHAGECDPSPRVNLPMYDPRCLGCPVSIERKRSSGWEKRVKYTETLEGCVPRVTERERGGQTSEKRSVQIDCSCS